MGKVWVGNVLGGDCPGGDCPGGDCPIGDCPRTHIDAFRIRSFDSDLLNIVWHLNACAPDLNEAKQRVDSGTGTLDAVVRFEYDARKMRLSWSMNRLWFDFEYSIFSNLRVKLVGTMDSDPDMIIHNDGLYNTQKIAWEYPHKVIHSLVKTYYLELMSFKSRSQMRWSCKN